MVIRNAGVAGAERRRSATHNPSWGFVTRKPTAVRATSTSSHNPSWGFVTQFFQLLPSQHLILITPHGDS